MLKWAFDQVVAFSSLLTFRKLIERLPFSESLKSSLPIDVCMLALSKMIFLNSSPEIIHSSGNKRIHICHKDLLTLSTVWGTRRHEDTESTVSFY